MKNIFYHIIKFEISSKIAYVLEFRLYESIIKICRYQRNIRIEYYNYTFMIDLRYVC